MSQNIGYYLAFSYCLGIGPVKFNLLIDRFGDAKTAYLASEKELKTVLNPAILRHFLNFRSKFDLTQEYDRLQKEDIKILTRDDDNYPLLLKQISDPPICLYLKGDSNIFKKYQDRFFSIVGSRITTNYGRSLVSQIAVELSSSDLIIVSGMALGIDSISHQSAINHNKPTVAVLGCGVNVIYPPENHKLYHDIISRGGAVISEFPPPMTVQRGLFVSRNRIISGISRGVLIVEGSARSGSLITASYAAQQGRDVFALPGPVNSTLSQAPNLLLKQGARFVTCAQDILDEYQLKIVSKSKNHNVHLDGINKIIFDCLANEPLNADQLSEKVNIPITEILKYLTMLEIRAIIAKNDQGKYFAV